MYRFLSVFLVGLFMTGGLRADDGKKLIIRWHGQSFYEIQTRAGTRIVLDPHAIESYGRITVKADLVFCTHPHNDHNRVEVIENKGFKRVDGVLGGDQIGKQKWNIVKGEKFKDVTYSIVGLYHDNSQGIKRGLNSAIVLEVDGLRIVHLGDLGHLLSENELKRIGKVDILMIPVGGVYTINGSEAKEVVAQLQPTRYILPMHYGTEVYDDLLPAREFLEDQKNVEKLQTNELVVDPSSKPPAKPTIVLLRWSKPSPGGNP